MVKEATPTSEPDLPPEKLAAGIAAMVKMAEGLDLSKAENAREITMHGERKLTGGIADADEETQAAVLTKVARFLDPKTAGPVYALAVRGKLFAGRCITAQEALQTERLAAVEIGTSITSGQYLTMMVGELLKSLYGSVPENSPRGQLLQAHLNDPDKWPKLDEINWMAQRDPYVRSEEIEPLWDLYQKWKAQVTPSADEIRFYYSRMT